MFSIVDKDRAIKELVIKCLKRSTFPIFSDEEDALDCYFCSSEITDKSIIFKFRVPTLFYEDDGHTEEVSVEVFDKDVPTQDIQAMLLHYVDKINKKEQQLSSSVVNEVNRKVLFDIASEVLTDLQKLLIAQGRKIHLEVSFTAVSSVDLTVTVSAEKNRSLKAQTLSVTYQCWFSRRKELKKRVREAIKETLQKFNKSMGI